MCTVVADLHIHTTRSDGEVLPSDLPAIARDADLLAVAVTDHERLPPWSNPYRTVDGLTVISGIELRVEADEVGRVDLLGYGTRRTEGLSDLVSTLQSDRIERAARMIDRLEAKLNVTLDFELEPGIGRPHLADAVSAQTELSVQDVFDRYIGEGRPCYVPRDIPAFDTGRQQLEQASDCVVLAHPLRYDDPSAALALVTELDGVEIKYPYSDTVDRRPLQSVLPDATVVKTGGSDAHTADGIGRCGLDRDEFDTVATFLGLSMD